MNVSFGSPAWLFALVLVPVVAWLGRALRSSLGRRRAAIVTGLRTTAIALVVLALAAPFWIRGGRGVDVLFLVDGSDSMAGAQSAARDLVAEAVAARGRHDRVALARFGLDAQPEFPLRADPPPTTFDTVVAGGGTDIARALRLAQGMLGVQQRRRVVLVSDGRSTQGDATRTAAGLAEAGVAVDVVGLGGAMAADVLVESVEAPGRVREGESYDLVAHLRNTGDTPVQVVLVTRRDGEEVDRRDQVLEPGATEVVVATPEADATGAVRWEVEVLDPADRVAANDIGRAGVLVDGPPRVLVVDGADGEAKLLVGALEAGNLPTDVVTSLPDLDRLLAYDAIVLVDVPAATLDDGDQRALDAAVRDAGRGLVLIGGDRSFGPGRWQDTVLEDLSPVFVDAQDPQRRPTVAEALVVDVSGSMAACHCRPAGFAGGPDGEVIEEGGVNKTDITRVAVARAIESLSQQDTVGVLAFNDSSKWVIPLQQFPSTDVVDDALSRLHPDGATNVVPALREAIAGLKDVNAELRHIVLFTDGFSEEPAMIEVAQDALGEGITLSVVGTGEGAGEILERMADAGGGRYYPGRDLSSIPDILVNEVQQVARPFIQEGVFPPVRTAPDPVVDRLDESPSVLGYVATTPKPTATTSLRVGDTNDPLLSRWQVGLGTSVAWTSDTTSIWAAPWVQWDGYGGFFADLVASTLPASGSSTLTATAVASPGGIEVRVDAEGTVADGATATAVVVGPTGDRQEVELERTSPTSWAGVVPGGEEGVTSVAVTLAAGGDAIETATTTAIRTYSAEYLPTADDAGLLAAVARAGGGRLDPDPATFVAANDLAPGTGGTPLASWLLLLALLTVPIDIGVRRLRVTRADLRRLRHRIPISAGADPSPVQAALATTLAARVPGGWSSGTPTGDRGTDDPWSRRPTAPPPSAAPPPAGPVPPPAAPASTAAPPPPPPPRTTPPPPRAQPGPPPARPPTGPPGDSPPVARDFEPAPGRPPDPPGGQPSSARRLLDRRRDEQR